MTDKKLLILLTGMMLSSPADVTAKSEFKLNCSNSPVRAKPNETVILECFTEPRMDVQRVEWMVNDTHEVHLYRNGKDENDKQWGEFKGRTSLFYSELSSGNCSLKLTAQMSHTGTYRCSARIQDTTEACFLNLTVRNISQISQVAYDQPQTTTSPKPVEDPSKNYVIAGSVSGGFGIVLIIIIAVVIWRRRNCNKKPNDKNLKEQQEKLSKTKDPDSFNGRQRVTEASGMSPARRRQRSTD